MGTVLRAKLSSKNPYWISKHRYYELKHFCLQYPEWKKAYFSLNLYPRLEHSGSSNKQISDPTENIVEKRELYFQRMELVEQTALEAFPDGYQGLLLGVTEGFSYDIVKARLEIWCSKDEYYRGYRRFFWLLDKKRR